MSRCPHCKKHRLDSYSEIRFSCGTRYGHRDLSREPALIEVGERCKLRWTFDKRMY